MQNNAEDRDKDRPSQASHPACDPTQPTSAEVDAVLAAARALVAISAQSVAAVDHRVTLTQLRVLVMIASRGPQNLHSVAQALGVHSSNATRVCDKLVEGHLLQRSEDPADRRNVILRLTKPGQHLVDTVTQTRRAAIATILAKMRVQHRSSLIPPLRAFTDAAGATPEGQAWALGWTTTNPHDDRHSQSPRSHATCGRAPQ